MSTKLPSIFISYAHKDNESSERDKRWLDRLMEHLEPLVQQGSIALYSDQDIELGDDWHDHIQTNLKGAQAAVLLVSPAFLASKYISNSELPVLLRNAKDQGVKIIPVLLRPCLFAERKFKYPDPQVGPEELSLASLQAAGSPAKALSEMTEGEQDRVLVKVAQTLARLTTSPIRQSSDGSLKPSNTAPVGQNTTELRSHEPDLHKNHLSVTKWILVAGSANDHLPEKIVATSTRLGRELANAGFGLISGGWPGVDQIVTRAFAEALGERERLADRLKQFRERGRPPEFLFGYIPCDSDNEAWTASIIEADAVVLIGGIGGTRETGEKALRLGKPVLPLADTKSDGHADAYNFYLGMMEDWRIKPIEGLTFGQLQDLSRPAPGVVTALIQLLNNLFEPPHPGNLSAEAQHRSSQALTTWKKRLAFLQTEEAKVADAGQRFSIQQQIEEALAKIQELEG